MFEQPGKVDALYKPPPGKRVLVFVDDVLNPLQYQPIKAELTERLNDKLVQKKIAAATVPYEDMMQWAGTAGDFSHASVAEAGQALGADWVLYVHIDKFSVRDDETNPLWHGQMATTVRLVDVRAGRLWPLDRPDGYTVPRVETPVVDDSSASYGGEVASQLAREMADRVTDLFCDHTVPPGKH